jgi:hypothetical protein
MRLHLQRRPPMITRVPTKITLDAYAASHRTVREMKEDGELPFWIHLPPESTLHQKMESGCTE